MDSSVRRNPLECFGLSHPSCRNQCEIGLPAGSIRFLGKRKCLVSLPEWLCLAATLAQFEYRKRADGVELVALTGR